jgi:hypothetical protein
MISKYLTPLYLIKIVGFLILGCLFMKMFNDDLQKFKNQMTTTGTRIRSHASKVKKLPCITVCAVAGFRKRGFYYLNQDYVDNTFEIQDFFSSSTLQALNNASMYSVKDVRSMYFGRCYKICHVDGMLTSGYKKWELKTDFNFKFFVHNDGDEFWLVSGITFFIDMAQTIIEVQRTDGINAGFYLFFHFCFSLTSRTQY